MAKITSILIFFIAISVFLGFIWDHSYITSSHFWDFWTPLHPYVSMFLVLRISKNWHFLTPLPPTSADVIYECSSRGFGGGLEQTFHMEVRDRDSGHLLQNLSNSASPIFTVRYFIVKSDQKWFLYVR